MRAAVLAMLALATSGCSIQAAQTFATHQPGRLPRTTEIAADLRPGGPFVGAEIIAEAAPEGFGARGANARLGYEVDPTPGSGEIWSVDVGGTAGAGRPPFVQDEETMFESGFFGDLALRIAGPGVTPGELSLMRLNLSLVLCARAQLWPAADGDNGEIAGGLGLRGTLDSDARSILQKVTKETANAFGL